MKSSLSSAAILALASLQGGRADIAVAKVVLATQYQICNGTGTTGRVLTREELENPCGTSAEPCPVFVKEHSQTTGTPAVPCGSPLEIQGLATGDGIQTQTTIHGIVFGYDNTLVGSSEVALAYNNLAALCEFPCLNGNVYTCVDHPDDCSSGVPLTIVQDGGVLASPLSEAGPFELRGRFQPPITDPQHEVPTFSAEPADPVLYESHPVFAYMMEIEEGEPYECGTLTGTAVPEAEAYLPNSCGSDNQEPCPLSGITDGIFGQCFDSTLPTPCLDVHFFVEGADDSSGIYCNDGGCDRIGSITRRFRMVFEEESAVAEGPVGVPIGAWRDMCPFMCEGSVVDSESNFCTSTADSCAHRVAPDTDPIGTPTDWTYMRPGSEAAKIKYLSHQPVACDATTTSTTTSSTPTSAQTSTAEQTSGAARAVVGGLTTVVLAASVLYL